MKILMIMCVILMIILINNVYINNINEMIVIMCVCNDNM